MDLVVHQLRQDRQDRQGLVDQLPLLGLADLSVRQGLANHQLRLALVDRLGQLLRQDLVGPVDLLDHLQDRAHLVDRQDLQDLWLPVFLLRLVDQRDRPGPAGL